MKKTLSIILLLLVLLLFNALQTLTYYFTRIWGDIDFYDIPTHVTTYLNALGALGCTLIAWKYLGKWQVKKLKFIYAFLFTIPLFAIFTSIFHILVRAYYGHPTSLDMLWTNFVFTLSFSHLYVSGFTIAYLFFSETNSLKEELALSHYELESMHLQMLTKNIEPHFLFNNLSILSSLTRKGSDQIDEFIEDLADVYRYFLLHNAADSVPIKDELAFLKKYIALTTKRFDKAYAIEIEIDDMEGDIVPFALQIAIENAIKHNEGSETNPLLIVIKRDNDSIIISNPIRPVEITSNTGLGLSNVSKRYQLLFNKVLHYGAVDHNFVVKVPVITRK
ncbi:histidine kinase [Pedobacter sp.]|uniref:sensor histidine kinase n=1 Tax=Pedobacter sp. TaxID=1411316 RepID=UPI0031DD8045